MVHGIGIDIVELARVKASLTRFRSKWLARLFSPGELAQAGDLAHIQVGGSRRCVEYWAARFAAKEAVVKALGTGWAQGLRWAEIEILKDGGGRPWVAFRGQATEIVQGLGVSQVLVSLSHSRTYAVAQALALRAPSRYREEDLDAFTYYYPDAGD